jgi:hypothetical protein
MQAPFARAPITRHRCRELYNASEEFRPTSAIGLTAVMLKFARYISSKFDSSFIPIYVHMVSGVRIQLTGASVLTPLMKLHLTNAEVGMWPPARRGHRGLRPGGNAEGWNRSAKSFFKTDRLHSFAVRCSSVSFSIRLDACSQRRRSCETTPKWHGFFFD